MLVEGCRAGMEAGSQTRRYRTAANVDRNRYQPTVVFYDDHPIAATSCSKCIMARSWRAQDSDGCGRLTRFDPHGPTLSAS
jgi:hypothetical protein